MQRTMLAICHETRALILELYPNIKEFGWDSKALGRVRYSRTRDIIYLKSERKVCEKTWDPSLDQSHYFPTPDFVADIEHLALNLPSGIVPERLTSYLAGFPTLRSVFFASDAQYRSSQPDMAKWYFSPSTKCYSVTLFEDDMNAPSPRVIKSLAGDHTASVSVSWYFPHAKNHTSWALQLQGIDGDYRSAALAAGIQPFPMIVFDGEPGWATERFQRLRQELSARMSFSLQQHLYRPWFERMLSKLSYRRTRKYNGGILTSSTKTNSQSALWVIFRLGTA